MHMFTIHVSFYIFAISYNSHRCTICISGGGGGIGGGGSDFILSSMCIISERFVNLIYLFMHGNTYTLSHLSLLQLKTTNALLQGVQIRYF